LTRCSLEALSPQIHFRPPMIMERDFFIDDILKDYRNAVVPPVPWTPGSALPHVHQRHHRQTQGLPARTGGYSPTSPAPQSITRTFIRRRVLCMADIGWITGHSTSSMARSLLLPPASFTKASRNSLIRASLAHRRTPRCEHLPHLAHRHSHASQAGAEEPKKHNYASST